MSRYLIYTQTNCVYCQMAKELLTKKGHTFDEIIVASAKDINEFKELGFTQVPQVFEHIGGYTELKEKLNDK